MSRAAALEQLGLNNQNWGPCVGDEFTHAQFAAAWRGTVPCPSEDQIDNAKATAQLEQTKDNLANAVQERLESAAKAEGYDSILSACSYAAYANTYQIEGQAFLSWRAACWDKCYAILAAAQQGQKYNASWANVIPTEAELLAELPALVLP